VSTSPKDWKPRQLAEHWTCGYEHVLKLITDGDLPAHNIATRGASRPLYRVRDEDRLAFEECREVRPATASRPKKRPRNTDVIEFFK
jgi:hypothetical protein